MMIIVVIINNKDNKTLFIKIVTVINSKESSEVRNSPTAEQQSEIQIRRRKSNNVN